MKIQNFVRDNAYYSSLRDRDRTINAEDIDKQFSILQNFINSKIIAIVDGLDDNKLLGSTEPQDLECYLENIGDGNTRWSKIRLSLAGNSMTLAKLQKTTEGSILATNADRAFTSVPLLDRLQLLTASVNSVPSWEYIKNNHFSVRSISGIKVDYQTIGSEHLAPNVIGADIDDNSITEISIAAGAVTGPKIADGAIDDNKISPALLGRRNNAAVWGNRSINAANLRSLSLNELFTIKLFFGADIAASVNNLPTELLNKITRIIPDNGIELGANAKIYPQYHIADGAIELRHIKLQSFSFANLRPVPPPQAVNWAGLNFQFLRTKHLSPRLKNLIGLN